MRCICCGCTDEAPCHGANTPTGTCFWTWTDDATETWGLCSVCAGIPFEQLMRKTQLSLSVFAAEKAQAVHA